MRLPALALRAILHVELTFLNVWQRRNLVALALQLCFPQKISFGLTIESTIALKIILSRS